MLHSRRVKQIAGAVMGLALSISSTAAGAATAQPLPISPLVALSAFGTPASASAVRPVVPVSNAATLPMSAVAVQGDYDDRRGISSWVPLVIILGAFVAVMIFVLSDDDGGHIDFGEDPVSPD
jgi:hypothetical protein